MASVGASLASVAKSVLRTLLKIQSCPKKEAKQATQAPHFSQYIAVMENAVDGNMSEDGDYSSLLRTFVALFLSLLIAYVLFSLFVHGYQWMHSHFGSLRSRNTKVCPGDLLPTVPADRTNFMSKPKVLHKMNEPVEVCLVGNKIGGGMSTPNSQSPKLSTPVTSKEKTEKGVSPQQVHVAISNVIQKRSHERLVTSATPSQPEPPSLLTAIKRSSMLRMSIRDTEVEDVVPTPAPPPTKSDEKFTDGKEDSSASLKLLPPPTGLPVVKADSTVKVSPSGSALSTPAATSLPATPSVFHSSAMHTAGGGSQRVSSPGSSNSTVPSSGATSIPATPSAFNSSGLLTPGGVSLPSTTSSASGHGSMHTAAKALSLSSLSTPGATSRPATPAVFKAAAPEPGATAGPGTGTRPGTGTTPLLESSSCSSSSSSVSAPSRPGYETTQKSTSTQSLSTPGATTVPSSSFSSVDQPKEPQNQIGTTPRVATATPSASQRGEREKRATAGASPHRRGRKHGRTYDLSSTTYSTSSCSSPTSPNLRTEQVETPNTPPEMRKRRREGYVRRKSGGSSPRRQHDDPQMQMARSPSQDTVDGSASKKEKKRKRNKAFALMQMYPECSLSAGCAQCQAQPLYPVTFRWHDVSAMSVFLTGSFLNWESKIPLARDRYGWVVELSLPKGHFEYKFIVDRNWAVDEKRQPTIITREGQINHVVHV